MADRRLTSHNSEDDLRLEAIVFCHYLIKKEPSKIIIDRYVKMAKANALNKINGSNHVSFAIKHPWSIGFLDGATSFKGQKTQLKLKLGLMFAICEATPDYIDYFLSKQRKKSYILYIAFIGLKSVLQTGFGLLMLTALNDGI